MYRGGNNRWLAATAFAAGGWLAWRGYRSHYGYDFRRKTVLLTGGSRGLGLVLARRLVSEGANVAICARDTEELNRALRDLAGRGGRVVAVPCDLTVPEQVGDMVATAESQIGPVDVLVNDAGIIGIGPVQDMRLDDFQKAMAGNFYSALNCILAVLPGMRKRKHGRIVNITSIGGKISVPHLLPYSASKFALVGLSEGLRSELARDGIVVTTVVPGLMRTGSPRQAEVRGQVRKEFAWFSISDALPIASISAERAARSIIRAVRRGDAEVTLSLPAKIAARVHGLLPGMTANLLSLTNRLLPAATGRANPSKLGKDIIPPPAPPSLTALNDRAAERNNEFDPREGRASDVEHTAQSTRER